jgi:hypothetical protein
MEWKSASTQIQSTVEDTLCRLVLPTVVCRGCVSYVSVMVRRRACGNDEHVPHAVAQTVQHKPRLRERSVLVPRSTHHDCVQPRHPSPAEEECWCRCFPLGV